PGDRPRVDEARDEIAPPWDDRETDEPRHEIGGMQNAREDRDGVFVRVSEDLHDEPATMPQIARSERTDSHELRDNRVRKTVASKGPLNQAKEWRQGNHLSFS